MQPYPQLTENISADVAIVGGGLTGILSAYFLSQAGKKVVLVEKDSLGRGATDRTTAFITQAIDTNLQDLVKMFDRDKARLIWQSGADAIDAIQEIIEKENIQCDFMRCPAYIYARTGRQFRKLKVEHAVAQDLGFQVELVSDGKLPFKNAGYLKLPHQAKFDARKFLRAVAEKAVAAGARIFENTEIIKVSDGDAAEVIVKDGSVISANDVIITTHLPFNNPKITHFKKGVYKSYVLETRLPHSDLEEAIYWDQYNPYNYFRVDKDSDGKQITFGGADHRMEIPMKSKRNFRALEKRLKEILGDVKYEITLKWSGPIIESSDGIPLIGEYAPHRYLATAFSGNGMTYAAVSALMFRDILSGKANPWIDLYNPKRKFTIYRLYKKGIDYTVKFFGGAVRNIFFPR